MSGRKAKLVTVATVLVCVATLVTGTWIATAETRSQYRCKANLKSLGVAFSEYHDQHKHFPAAYSEKNPPHSWRVELLPHLGQQSLHDSYDFGEAWNSPANRRVLSQRPSQFECPEVVDPKWTSYVGVVGMQTAWPYYESTCIDDFVSGTSMSILVMDIHTAKLPWTEPRDPSFNEVLESGSGGWVHGSGSTNVLLADGSTHSIAADVDPEIMAAVLSPKNGGPTTDNPDLWAKSFADVPFKPIISRSEFSATNLSPVADVELKVGQSMLYCPTFVLAWKEVLERRPDLPLTELGRKLSEAEFANGDVSAKSIRTDVEFSVTSLKVSSKLAKQLAFPSVFDSFDVPLQFETQEGKKPVKSFGVTSHWDEWETALKQVFVQDYRSPQDFIITIQNSTGDDLILAKMPTPATLSEAVESIVERIRMSDVAKNAQQIVPPEDLVIPVLDVSIFDDFKQELDDETDNIEILKARQELQFRLNERGATVYSSIDYEDFMNGKHSYAPGTRKFIFDKPFLVMMREGEDKRPYFAAWIANTDLMIPREK